MILEKSNSLRNCEPNVREGAAIQNAYCLKTNFLVTIFLFTYFFAENL